MDNITIRTSRTDGLRECATCHSVHPETLEYFYKRKRSNGFFYYSSSCKSCVKKHRQERYNADPEKYRAEMAAARKIHGAKWDRSKQIAIKADPERAKRVAAIQRQWELSNLSMRAVYRRAYYLANTEKIKEAADAYRRSNPEQSRASRMAYKARKKGAEGSFSADDLCALFQKQSGKCFWCGESIGSGYHVDHYIALAKGGSNYPDNIVLACQSCNTSKRDKSPEEFVEYLALIKDNKAAIEERRERMSSYMRGYRKRAA